MFSLLVPSSAPSHYEVNKSIQVLWFAYTFIVGVIYTCITAKLYSEEARALNTKLMAQ